MKQLIVTDDYLPIPFPNDDVQKVRDWLGRVIPLWTCQRFIEAITDVTYDRGPGAPQWIRALAKEIAAEPLLAIDLQLLCYNAMLQQSIRKAFESIFEMSFNSGDMLFDTATQFPKDVGLLFRWRLETAAAKSEEFRSDPVVGRATFSRVWFELKTDTMLFGKTEAGSP